MYISIRKGKTRTLPISINVKSRAENPEDSLQLPLIADIRVNRFLKHPLENYIINCTSISINEYCPDNIAANLPGDKET